MIAPSSLRDIRIILNAQKIKEIAPGDTMEHTSNLILLKSTYSEDVIRKSLYWLSEHCQWELNEKDNSWEVCFRGKEDNIVSAKTTFHRILNDFKLREQLDAVTGNLRKKIITNTLIKLSQSE